MYGVVVGAWGGGGEGKKSGRRESEEGWKTEGKR